MCPINGRIRWIHSAETDTLPRGSWIVYMQMMSLMLWNKRLHQTYKLVDFDPLMVIGDLKKQITMEIRVSQKRNNELPPLLAAAPGVSLEPCD